ncbi:MAG: D-alanyl-D-alanine carboxypeptidase, partial [Beijerinckiaceae bacterium]|nr:D-alanyl-D-alanine carboxypeptidase [Beijerinckiaceae bacterium]
MKFEFGAPLHPRLKRASVAGLCAVAASLAASPASARHHHHRHAFRARVEIVNHSARLIRVHQRGGGYTPPFSAFAIDGNSGRVLYGQDENGLRHPASITKVMTLYLLFGELERHRLSLDTRIEVSAHAAAQKPTKLGLRPGSTIRIEDAIKAIVTKSANDMAVAIGERIGGSEPAFAAMMTRKAHALGMSRTNFVNASGLPADEQWTTARDLATLGRAIHDRYPQYFHYFSTHSFTYAGQTMPNHNHLMDQVEGMDGIKTGYTNASGFNLLSSVNRNGHWLVSVVLGGKTRLGRDRIMADLIEAQIDHCATRRSAPMVAENPDLEHVAEAIPVVTHVGEEAPPVEGVDDEAAAEAPPPAPRPKVAAAEADA